jgi:hypothetical protein
MFDGGLQGKLTDYIQGAKTQRGLCRSPRFYHHNISHSKYWSATAIITIVIINLYMASMLTLTLVYNNWLLEKIKTSYDKKLPERNAP